MCRFSKSKITVLERSSAEIDTYGAAMGPCWSRDRSPCSHYLFSVAFAKEKGYTDEQPMKLDCLPLEKVGGYDLSKEDPGVFAALDPLVPREWPGIPLPTFQAQAQAAVAEATRSKGKEPQPPVPERSDVVKELLEIHRSYVEVLLSMGVDPIKEYHENKATTILSGVKSGDTKCRVCDKRCSSTQKLKNHIRRRHIGKTPWHCGECNRYYGDSQSLKVHMRKHLPEDERQAVTQECNVCKKTYCSVGKLNEHMQKHQQIRCQYCNDTFAYKRTCKAHEAESCPQRPEVQQPAPADDPGAAAPEPVHVKRWHCHVCDTDYGARRNLKKHLNGKHDGVDVAKDAFR